uniref:Glycoprotein n=1 Tax=Liman tick virus TaxID=2789420 RepID=A0A7S8F9C6_9VIRU|nr:glycoprotein [Liman tick virus]
MSIMMNSVFTVLFVVARVSCSLVGFDCSEKPANITAVSLESVARCSRDTPGVVFSNVYVQLLQTRASDHVPARGCLVERSYIISHCGMHSHSSATAQGFHMGEILYVGPDECLLAHTTGKLVVSSMITIVGLKVNETTTKSLTEMGQIEAGTHSCVGTSFSVGGVTYSSAVMQSSYKITLSQPMLSLDLDTGMVRTNGGYTHKFAPGHTFDPDLGYLYWNPTSQVEACTPHAYLVLYEGNGVVATEAGKRRTLMINTTEVALAVGVTQETLVCHQHAYRTDHPRLYTIIRYGEHTAMYFQRSLLDPVDVDLFLYTNTKLVFVERHLAREIQSLYAHYHERVCALQHQTLQQLVTLAYVSPEEFAWAYSGKPGVSAVIRGEVVYIIECQPVTVSFRQTDKCFQEIPIWTPRNQTGFLKPRSRVITSFGTEIDCSPLAPALFRLGSTWVSFSPNPTQTTPPTILTAQPSHEWSYSPVPNLLTAGVYSSTTLLQYQRRLMFPVAKDAIINTVAARVAGVNVDAQHLDVSRMIRDQALDGLHHSFMQRMYGWWWNVSVNVAGVMGVIYMLVLLRGIVSTALNGAFLYRTFGCGLKLFAAVFGTLAKYLLLQEHLHHQHTDREDEQAPDSTPLTENTLSGSSHAPAGDVPRLYPTP